MAAKVVRRMSIQLRELSTGAVEIDLRPPTDSQGGKSAVMAIASFMAASARKPLTFQQLPPVSQVRLVARLPNGKDHVVVTYKESA